MQLSGVPEEVASGKRHIFQLPRWTNGRIGPPAPRRLESAIDVILYTYDTAEHALRSGGGDVTFETWSDASYTDNMFDGRSPQAYSHEAVRRSGGLESH